MERVLRVSPPHRPVAHHAGGVPQNSAHCAPTIFADCVDQRLLCLAPLWLGALDELAALVRDRNDPDTLVSAGPAVDQLVPLQRSEHRNSNGGSDKCGGIPMDSLITAAARALATGDPLGALNRIALRDDAPALALRGIAMAQLGDLVRAKALLRSAARAFGPKEAVARARCVVAEAEIALVSRDLTWPAKALDAARATLEAHGDHVNAAHARTLELRRLLLIGCLNEAERMLAELDPTPLPPAWRSTHELVVAGVAVRRLRTKAARAAFTRAERAAREANIPALTAEVESASLVMSTTAARLIARGEERPLMLEEVEALLASGALVVDACRHVVRHASMVVSLATRPVLFALARALAEAWPADVPRSTLLARAFRAKHADESHRARLRVEV